MKNMAGPCLARSGMGFWPPFVPRSLRLQHSHVLLAQPRSTQGSLLPWALRVPTGQTRRPARGLPRVREGRVVGGPGEARGGGEAWRRFLEDSRLRWVSLSQGHYGHTKATALEWIVSGLGFSTRHLGAQLGYRGRPAPWRDGPVSADPSRSGHPTDNWSPSSDTLLCPTPRRGLSAPE